MVTNLYELFNYHFKKRKNALNEYLAMLVAMISMTNLELLPRLKLTILR